MVAKYGWYEPTRREKVHQRMVIRIICTLNLLIPIMTAVLELFLFPVARHTDDTHNEREQRCTS